MRCMESADDPSSVRRTQLQLFANRHIHVWMGRVRVSGVAYGGVVGSSIEESYAHS
jgi:hypothetical protein